jgi:tRNA U34 5-methylaminomethyl-2-thiouridine-forming methyltransferase MnmC
LTNQILKLNPELVITADGSHTLFVKELNEHYHSVHGAIQESSIIYIQNGYKFCTADPVNIFEVGFGTGLNALLTAIQSRNEKRTINYTSIEKFPLPENIIMSLNHFLYAGENGKNVFNSIHSAKWNDATRIHGNFFLKKITGDITVDRIEGIFDLVYFDAFGPGKQPEMWTKEVFGKIAETTRKNGVLVTYSCKGEVKRILRSCGFDVFLLPGPPGKRQMIRAIKF